MRSILMLSVLLCGCASVSDPEWSSNPAATPTDATPFAVDAGPNGCQPVAITLQTPGAWLQVQPQIHLVFFGSYWLYQGLSEFDFYALAWNQLANDVSFYTPMSEYGIQTGSLNGIFSTGLDIEPGGLSEDELLQELISELDHSDLPLPDINGNSNYVIMLPVNITDNSDATNNWYAHHSAATYHGVQFNYSVIDYNSSQETIMLSTSHEIYEAATDPDGSGYHGSGNESEVGDLCNQQPYLLDGYQIQQLWSEQACKCIPSN